jgi:hypothetical protein
MNRKIECTQQWKHTLHYLKSFSKSLTKISDVGMWNLFTWELEVEELCSMFIIKFFKYYSPCF